MFSVNNMNTYMIFFLEFTKPDNEAIGWLYVIIHVYMFYWEWLCHDYFNCFMVILRSTTGPYRRPIVEVAYGEMLCSLHRGCMGVDSSGRVVRHTRVNTSMGTVYIIFWVFIILKLIYIFKPICSIKEHWWFLSLSWPDEVQRMVFDRPFDFI